MSLDNGFDTIVLLIATIIRRLNSRISNKEKYVLFPFFLVPFPLFLFP